jgi:hypothetical protein
MNFLGFAQSFGRQWLLSCPLCDVYLLLYNIPSQLLLSFPLHFYHNKLIHLDAIINIPNTIYDKLTKLVTWRTGATSHATTAVVCHQTHSIVKWRAKCWQPNKSVYNMVLHTAVSRSVYMLWEVSIECQNCK